MRRSSKRYTGEHKVSPSNGARGCNGKRCYESFKAANGVAQHARHELETALAPYRCRACGSWHLGGDGGKPRKKPIKTRGVVDDEAVDARTQRRLDSKRAQT